jgi:hypothetical protein
MNRTGDRVERVVLFGSRARGDARNDPDYDLAVFIQNPGSLDDELSRLAAISTEILLETGAIISAKPFLAGACRERSGLDVGLGGVVDCEIRLAGDNLASRIALRIQPTGSR